MINGFPGWSDMLRGRTTVVESWNGGSLNHIVLTAPLDSWFYTTLAGIQLDEANPAYANIVIKPWFPKDLDWVTAWVNTIRGRVGSSWKVQNKILTMEVTIPANATAVVHLPTNNARDVLESGRPAAKTDGVTFTGKQAEYATFRIGSGHYIFTCPIVR
jgi:alpha-L-rhamnosidase